MALLGVGIFEQVMRGQMPQSVINRKI